MNNKDTQVSLSLSLSTCMIVDLIGSLWCILCLSLRWTHVFKLESPCDLIIADNSCMYQEHYCDYKLYLLYDIITLWLNPHHYLRRCYFSIRKHIDTLKIPENNNSYFTFTLLNIFFCDYFIDFHRFPKYTSLKMSLLGKNQVYEIRNWPKLPR